TFTLAPTAASQVLTIGGSGNTVINDTILDGNVGGTASITVSAGGGSNAVPAPLISFNAMNTYSGGTLFSGAATLVPVVNSSNALPGASFTAGPFGTGQINVNNG